MGSSELNILWLCEAKTSALEQVAGRTEPEPAGFRNRSQGCIDMKPVQQATYIHIQLL